MSVEEESNRSVLDKACCSEENPKLDKTNKDTKFLRRTKRGLRVKRYVGRKSARDMGFQKKNKEKKWGWQRCYLILRPRCYPPPYIACTCAAIFTCSAASFALPSGCLINDVIQSHNICKRTHSRKVLAGSYTST